MNEYAVERLLDTLQILTLEVQLFREAYVAHNSPKIERAEQIEPQTDCGDFADRLAYERGVKHAWEVAQKVFDSTVTFYEAEDVAKQIDKDINVRSKDEPQTPYDECKFCKFWFGYCHLEACDFAPIEDEPQTDCAWK